MRGFSVALADSVEFTDIVRYVNDSNYWFEQKLDGVRLAVAVEDGKVTGINRRGVDTPVDRRIHEVFVGTKGTWVFDGEWVDGMFWTFDLPIAPGITEVTPYQLRRASLDAIVPILTERSSAIRLLPTHRSPEEKVAIAREVIRRNAEGLMLKDKRAAYSARRSPAMLKAKIVETLDCIVSEVGREGKRSVAVVLYDDGRLVDVGSVTMTDANLALTNVGDVIEVKYLYVTGERRLYQPRFVGFRKDKLPTECTVGQLKFTDKTVIDTVNS